MSSQSHPQLLARGLAEVLQRIDRRPALHQCMQLADRLVRCEVGVQRCAHDLLSARNSSREGQDAHPADHGVEGDELLDLWLVAHDGIAIYFRCRDDEVLVEVLSLRLIVGELPGPRLARWLSQVVKPEVRPPTTEPASAESAEM